MADYPYYDEDPKRRRRRRRNYEEDAWGMAETEDAADGVYGDDLGDYAAGMVDEEGRRFQNVRDPYDPIYEEDASSYTMPASATDRPASWRSEHIPRQSDGLERAAELMAKFNERNSVQGRATLTPQGHIQASSNHKSPRNTARISDAPRQVNSSGVPAITFFMVLMITLVMLSCISLVAYAAFG